jgi:hypothetical protein
MDKSSQISGNQWQFFNQDRPPYFKVDIIFEKTISARSLTRPDQYQPVSGLVLAITWEILAL